MSSGWLSRERLTLSFFFVGLVVLIVVIIVISPRARIHESPSIATVPYTTVESNVTPRLVRLVLVVSPSTTGEQALLLAQQLDSSYYSAVPLVTINVYNSQRAAANLLNEAYPVDSINAHWAASYLRNDHSGIHEGRTYPGR